MAHHRDFGFGAAIGAFFGMIPDSMLSLGGKAFLAILTAFVTGFTYRAGQALFDKMKGKKDVG